MQRREFLLSITAGLTARRSGRGFATIIQEINDADKRYSRVQKLVVERAKFFHPMNDPAIKGWFRELSKLSKKLGDLFEELSEL